MSRIHFRTSGLLALSCATVFWGLVSACGKSSDGKADNPSGDQSTDGGPDGSAGGQAGSSPGPDCNLVGTTCAANSDCCSASCDVVNKICVSAAGSCKPSATECASPVECCTHVCSGGKCGATVCTSDNQPCTTNDSCCGGTCSSGVCVPLNATCKTAGNACAASTECCSHLCKNGICAGQSSFCTQTGDACGVDFECCGGICKKSAGATVGVCASPSAPGATGCALAGVVCGAGAAGAIFDGGLPRCGGECCSRACAPFGPTGVMVCQPPSGCRPTGEACRADRDCCGSPELPGGGNGNVHCSKAPGESIGRCDNGTACRANGAICRLATNSCNAEANCCAGNVLQNPSVCQQDILGIPRCTAVGDCSPGSAQSYVGKACASSADCCGLFCLPNAAAGGAPFVCGATCVTAGGQCTTSADCCPGLPCVLLPGSSAGTCGASIPTDGGTASGDAPSDAGGGAGGGNAGTDGGSPAAADSGSVGCALYGQDCTTLPCCSGVPCTQGRCQVIVR